MSGSSPRVLFIGFGEAAQAFAAGWRGAGLTVDASAYDLKLDDPGTADAKRRECEALGVRAVPHARESFQDADLVLSLVTAEESLGAAKAAADLLPQGKWFCDFNSVSPQTKQAAAAVIQASGGRYADVAVLAPVHPRLHRTPLLVAAPDAGNLVESFAALRLDTSFCSERIGDAAAVKLLRSIIIKGLEALIVECSEGCEAMGLGERVYGSLANSFPGIDWTERVAYALDRVRVHGLRRAAEMREAAQMLEAAGLGSIMSHATADRLGGAVGEGSPVRNSDHPPHRREKSIGR